MRLTATDGLRCPRPRPPDSRATPRQVVADTARALRRPRADRWTRTERTARHRAGGRGEPDSVAVGGVRRVAPRVDSGAVLRHTVRRRGLRVATVDVVLAAAVHALRGVDYLGGVPAQTAEVHGVDTETKENSEILLWYYL